MGGQLFQTSCTPAEGPGIDVEQYRADCGYVHPGGDFSAGIGSEAFSQEQAQGEGVNSFREQRAEIRD